MVPWNGWPFDRLIYLFLGAAYLMMWIQVTLSHWRGGFRNPFMWGPVLATPFISGVALMMGFYRGDMLELIFVVLFAAGVLEGMVGTFFHLRGAGSMVGGLTIRNLMSGPPVMIPMMYMALAAFGLLIHYLPSLGGAR